MNNKRLMKVLGVLIAMALLAAVLPMQAKAETPPLEVWVDDSFPSEDPTHFKTINGGINAVAVGGKVNVAAGMYDEQVVITKSLTLQGDGDATIIKPTSAAKLSQIFEGLFWFDTPNTKQIAGIIVANVADGSPVTIKSLKVDESLVTTKPTGADYLAGIFYRETGGTVDTVTVAGTGAWSSGDRAYGMYLSAGTNTVTVEVKDSTITNFDRNGIEAMGNKLTANIHDNTITGRGPLLSGDEVQNGINIGRGARGTVNANTISNMSYSPLTWWSAGVIVVTGGSAKVTNNTIDNCQIGVIFDNSSGEAQDNTVAGGGVGLLGLWAQYDQAGTWTATFSGNTVTAANDTDDYENAAIGCQTWNAGASVTFVADDNTLTGNTGTTADGIYIGDVLDGEPAGTIQATITDNTISGWQHGIRLVSSVAAGSTITGNTITNNVSVDSGIHIDGAVNAANVAVHFNNFVGNEGYDVYNGGTGTLDASSNWWGSPEGPEPSSYSAHVIYQPWAIFSNLVLDNSDIDENLEKGALVGTFSPVDAVETDVFTYALVEGAVDNAKFKIVGDQLLSNEKFDFETKSSYEILVSVEDAWEEEVFEKTFTIDINNVNEDPVLTLTGVPTTKKEERLPISFTASATDPDGPLQALTFSLDGAPENAEIDETDGSFDWTPSEEQGPGKYTFTVKVCDDGEPELCVGKSVTIEVTEKNEPPKADDDVYGVLLGQTLTIDTEHGVLANDTDDDIPENDLSARVTGAPGAGNLVLNLDGSFTYTPPATAQTVTFHYKVSDGTLEDEGDITFYVRATNVAPTAITFTPEEVFENTVTAPKVGSFTTTDGDLGDIGLHVYSFVEGPGDDDNDKFTIDGSNLFAIKPFNYEDQHTFSVRISTTDPFGASIAKAFTIEIGDANDAPQLDSIPDQEVNEGTLLRVAVEAEDEDEDILTYSLVGEDYGANISQYGGIFEWRPAEEDGPGKYNFTVQVCDNHYLTDYECVTKSFNVVVKEVNLAPVAADNDTVSVNEGGDINIALVGNDPDHSPSANLTYIIVSLPTHGTLSGTAPSLTYTPAQNYNGTDSFTFKVYDGNAYSNIATVTITVNPKNDKPKAKDDSYITLKGQALRVDKPGVLANDTDVDGDQLTAQIETYPTKGALQFNPDGSFIYTPNVGSSGLDTFTYYAKDSKGVLSNLSATVTINVLAENHAPTGITLTSPNAPENEIYKGTLKAVDVDLYDTHNFELVPGVGAVDNDDFEIDGNQLISKIKFNFEEQFIYQVRIKVTDSFDESFEKPFVITVADINDAPVAEDQTITTLINEAVEFELAGSDEDGDDLTYAIFSEPEHGTLKATVLTGINFAGNGVLRVIENNVTYTPDEGFAGEDTFTFKVMDEAGLISNLATVTIQVSDLPIAVDDAYEATEDEELSVDAEEGVLANDTIHDETVELVAALVDDVSHGTLELAPDGSFKYLPEENFVGEDEFTYNACIEGGECSEEPATVTITVEPVNDEPNAVDDEYETPMGKKLEVPAPGVLENDIDPDPSDEQTVEVKDLPLHGELVLNADGSFTYEPDAGFHGIDTFTYWLISEPGVQSAYMDSATVTITVRPVARIFLPIILK